MINENLINNENNFSFSAYSNDKKLFLINSFIENDYLNLYCLDLEKNKKIEYICKVTYEELKQVKILSITENLEEAFNSIKDIINNNYKMNDNPLIIKETNQLILIIPIKIRNCNDLVFKLDEKEKEIKEIINELIIEDEEKEKKINQLLNTINLINKKIEEKENIIKTLESKINQIELQFENKKNSNEKF